MYQKQTWNNNDEATPLEAGRLRHIEDGIETAAVAASVSVSLHSRVVVDGDSITIGGTTNNVSGTGIQDRGSAWAHGMAQASNGRMNLVYNAGVAGQTSTAMLARFDTYVAVQSPDLVIATIGTNDMSSSVGTTAMNTWLANLEEYRLKCDAIGADLVVGAVYPTSASTPTGRSAAVATWNEALRDWAFDNSVRVIPFDALRDPATGGWPAGWSSDGVHPTLLDSYQYLGQLAWDSVQDLFGGAVLRTADKFGDGVIDNGLFLSTTGTPAMPTAWSALSGGTMYAGAGVQTATLTDRIVGNYLRLKPLDTGALAGGLLTPTGVAVPGEVWEISGLVRGGGGGTGYAGVRLRTGTTSVTNIKAWNGAPLPKGAWGRFHLRLTIPTGTDNLLPLLAHDAGTSSAWLDFAEIRLAKIS